MTVQTIKSVRTDDMFNLFWAKVTQRAISLSINDPQLLHCRKRMRRYDDDDSVGDFHSTPKAYFRQSYYEAIDLVVGCVENRFDQPEYRIYRTLESLILKVCKQDDISDDLKAILSFYKMILTMNFCQYSFKLLEHTFNRHKVIMQVTSQYLMLKVAFYHFLMVRDYFCLK